jgi:hypothetical protein
MLEEEGEEEGKDPSLVGEGVYDTGGSVLGLKPPSKARRKGLWVLLHRRTRGRAERKKSVGASSSPALNHSTQPAATAYTPLRMAASISRSSRSLLNTHAAVPSLSLLVPSASSVSHPPRLECLEQVSVSACGSTTSSLRTRCLQDQSSSKRQSGTLPAQSILYRTHRQAGHGFAGLPNGARWSSTSIPPPPGARDGPDDVKRLTSSKQRPSGRSEMPPSRDSGTNVRPSTHRHWERRENPSDTWSGPHGKPSHRHFSPQGTSGSQFDSQRKTSWSQRDPQRTPSEQRSGPNRRPVSAAPRPMQSGGASLSIPRTANDRGPAQPGKRQNGLTESESTPPPPPYDILFCGTDFFALEVVRALYGRRGQ